MSLTGRRRLEIERRENARDAANVYAPVPESSSIMYGFVATVLLAVFLWFVGKFYGLDLLRHPISIGVGLILIFIGGVLLRRRRKHQHNRAFDTEYERGGSTERIVAPPAATDR